MVVILIGLFVAVAMAFPAAMTSLESISDAHGYQQDQIEALHNADIELVDATYDEETETLTVNVTNSGSEDLTVQATHLLVDGAFADPVNRTIESHQNATTWLPGETLELAVEDIDEPDRIKVVAELGLTVITEEVETDG